MVSSLIACWSWGVIGNGFFISHSFAANRDQPTDDGHCDLCGRERVDLDAHRALEARHFGRREARGLEARAKSQGLALTADDPEVRGGRLEQRLDARLIERVIVRGDAAVDLRAAGQCLGHHVRLLEATRDAGEPFGVEPLGALVDDGHLKAHVQRERGELFGDVTGAEDEQRRGRAMLLEEDGHLAAAAHAEIVREVGLEGLRLSVGLFEQHQRRVDHLLLDGAAADGAAQAPVGEHHQPRAWLLRRTAV